MNVVQAKPATNDRRRREFRRLLLEGLEDRRMLAGVPELLVELRNITTPAAAGGMMSLMAGSGEGNIDGMSYKSTSFATPPVEPESSSNSAVRACLAKDQARETTAPPVQAYQSTDASSTYGPSAVDSLLASGQLTGDSEDNQQEPRIEGTASPAIEFGSTVALLGTVQQVSAAPVVQQSLSAPAPIVPVFAETVDVVASPTVADSETSSGLKLVDAQGNALNLSLDDNTIVVGAATWCSACALLKTQLANPQVALQLQGLRIVFAFGNEGGAGPGGVSKASYLQGLPGEVAFLAIDSVRPTRFPSAFNPQTGQFDQHAATAIGEWLQRSAETNTFATTTSSEPTPADSDAAVAVAQSETLITQPACGCGSKKTGATTSDAANAASRETLSLVVSAGLSNTINAGGPYALSEGESLALAGVVSEPSEGLTYLWDVNGDGTFGDATGLNPELSWAQLTALGIENGPSSFNVRLRVDDGDGGIMTSSPVRLTVMNATPKVTISGPADVAVGQSANYVLTATDPSPGDQAATFTYRIDWNGDGVVDQVINGPATINVSHTYAQPGPARVRVTATDRDNGASSSVTLHVAAAGTLLSPNAENPALTDLVWGGTSGADEVSFVQLDATTILVTETRLNGSVVNNVQTHNNITGRVIARGAAGNDLLEGVALTVTKATLDGGHGNDTLYGGQAGDLLIGGSDGGEGQQGHNTIVAGHGDNTIYGNAIVGAEGSNGGNNLIVGGAGNDTIYGNFGTVQKKNGNPSDGAEGGQNLIVGGEGSDLIYASQQVDGAEGGHGSILIAGGTTLNETALSSVLSEWTSNRDYATRIANISGTGLGPRNNGTAFLQAGTTLVSDAALDALYSDSQGDPNWLLYDFAQDQAHRVKGGEVETDLLQSGDLAPGEFSITGPEPYLTYDDILITWQASEGATSYQVLVSDNADLSSPFVTQTVVGTQFAMNDVGGPRTIYVGVVAINEHGVTPAGNTPYEIFIDPPDLRQTLFVTDLVYAPFDIDFIPPLAEYFGSALAADYHCTSAASNAGLLDEPWDGSSLYYQALLVNDLGSLTGRVAIGDLGFDNVLGEEIAADYEQLLSGNHTAPILTASGSQLLESVPVWTGVSATGEWSGFACESWTNPYFSAGTVGNVNGTGSMWLDNGTRSCALTARLYCVSITA